MKVKLLDDTGVTPESMRGDLGPCAQERGNIVYVRLPHLRMPLESDGCCPTGSVRLCRAQP